MFRGGGLEANVQWCAMEEVGVGHK